MFKQVSIIVYFLVFGVFLLGIFQCSRTDNYQKLIKQGQFSKAADLIRFKMALNPDIDPLKKRALQFEIERMDRIRKDFTKSKNEVLNYIQKYIPSANEDSLEKWENQKDIEYMVIDGEKKYFHNAARNFFRVNPQAEQIKKQIDAPQKEATKEEFPLNEHAAQIIAKSINSSRRYVKPVTMQIQQTVTVDTQAVPAEEMIRCWIPFPREVDNRQINIKILETEPADYVLADNNHLQRTIYFEKCAVKNQPTRFFVKYKYTSYGVYQDIDPARVKPAPAIPKLKPYLSEQPPHIVFTEELTNLSKEIVGDEKNPYRIAQKLFAWVDKNIPWASAREYSTLRNISMYPYLRRHGDCGIQTLMFMALCRINGIPTKWQSGWEFQPPDDSMHDWGEIYFEPYGWVPMDVTYGIRNARDEHLKWFYLSGMDSYRLILNDAYSQAFYPLKIHFRSETVDSQRGEVEWEGGNLYFDQWDWDLAWQVLSED